MMNEMTGMHDLALPMILEEMTNIQIHWYVMPLCENPNILPEWYISMINDDDGWLKMIICDADKMTENNRSFDDNGWLWSDDG